MHRAANTSRFLIDFSSQREFADPESLVSHSGLLQHILTSRLARATNSRQLINDLAQRLIRLAEHAYALREMNRVEEASSVLMNLPLAGAQQIGLFYQALTFKRNGNTGEAQSLFEAIADSGPLAYRARAIQALGALHCDRGELDEALRFHIEASRAASFEIGGNALATLMVHLEISHVQSEMEDHRGALANLESLTPLVHLVVKRYPFYFYVYHNELAVELGEIGRIAEAGAACEIAIASPFASAYPEWTETRDEIAAKRQSASPSFVAVNRAPEVEPSPQIEPQREPRRSRARLSTWLASEKASFQRASIVTVVSAVAVHDGLAQSILDRVRTGIRPRAPPAVR